MKIYVGGPMRGYPNLNYANFDRVKERLEKLGHVVVTPADLNRKREQSGLLEEEPPESFDRQYLSYVLMEDLSVLSEVDAIVLLDGWKESEGTTVEVAFAQALGIPIYNEKVIELLPEKCPYRKVETITLEY